MYVFEGEEFENVSLRKCFIKKFGEEVVTSSRQYESCCLKLARYKNHVIFNLRCKKRQLIPPSLCIHSPVDSSAGREIALRASKAYVRERIRISERNKREAASEKERREIDLRRILGDETFERFDSLVGKKYERVS